MLGEVDRPHPTATDFFIDLKSTDKIALTQPTVLRSRQRQQGLVEEFGDLIFDRQQSLDLFTQRLIAGASLVQESQTIRSRFQE